MNQGWVLLAICSIVLPCCSGSKPAGLGVNDGKFAPCPASPNCVSSQSDNEKHHIAPLRYTGALPEARQALIKVIRNMKRTEITESNDRYIHAEFTSAVFRFVDDVEFLFDDARKVIHVRSASRVGYSDLGVNRKRVERIRAAFTARAATTE